MKRLIQNVRVQTSNWLDTITNELIRSEGHEFGREPGRHNRLKALSPDEDVKKLIISASSLEDIWYFLMKRLRTSSEPEFIMFSVVDETAELLRLRFIWPSADRPLQGEFIPLCDRENHLIKTVTRCDTTFTNRAFDLGREVAPFVEDPAREKYNIFSIPLIAGNRTIAVITLGFDALDSFSQAKLSYVYLLRDHLAHVVWNLILQERLQNQPQLDNLTGLITHSSFHQVLKKEVRRAACEGFPLSLLLIDINNLKTYNEHYSHQMGDRAIARLASMVKHEVRGIDTVARYGSDEIAVILPESDSQGALDVANRIVQSINAPQKQIKPFSISIGIACYPEDSQEVEDMIQLVENALHFGKHHSDRTSASSVILGSELQMASDQERLEVFTDRIAKQYGETGSELFDILLRRVGGTSPQATTESLMLETVASLAGAMDAKDKYTRGHSQSVANYAVALSHAIGLPPADVEKIRLAAFFHDIGKIGIPESILNKPGPLTEQEKEIMKQHPVIGARQILQPVTALRDIVPLVEYHHEQWDGNGHPEGLKGENIPIGARVVSIVDAFHALTSNRPYRKAMSIEDAMKILHEGAGTIWDPTLVQKFAEMVHRAKCQNSSAEKPLANAS